MIINIAESAKAMFGFPCTLDELTSGERNILKRLAVAYGKRASQMSDVELIELYNNIDIAEIKSDNDHDSTGDEPTDGAVDADDDDGVDAGDADDASDDADDDADDADGAGDEVGMPEVLEEYEPKNALEKEIVDIIKKVHPTLSDGMHDGVDEETIKRLIDEHGGGKTTIEIKKA